MHLLTALKESESEVQMHLGLAHQNMLNFTCDLNGCNSNDIRSRH